MKLYKCQIKQNNKEMYGMSNIKFGIWCLKLHGKHVTS
jgi:hypothetical protein